MTAEEVIRGMPPVGRAKGRKEAEAKRREIEAALAAGFSPLDIAEEFGTTERAVLLVEEAMTKGDAA